MRVGLKEGLRKRLREQSEKEAFTKKVKAKLAYRLHVSGEEWKVAKNYFKRFGRLGKIKLRRNRNMALKHSFIKIKGHLVALANKHIEGSRAILGKGNYGIVKLGENESGKNFALKIEAGTKRPLNNQELKVLEKVPNYYHGEADRSIPKKEYMGQETTSKLYTLMELLEGKELEKQLDTLNNTQKLIVALKSCLAMRELHQNNIIHADVKPGNFMANIIGNDITVRAVDFGFSMLLKPGQKIFYEPGWKGTPDYMAPEVYCGEYSAQSDIYALGHMLQEDLQLPSQLYQNMLHPDPAQRPPLKDTIIALLNELERMTSDAGVRQLVADIRTELSIASPKPPSPGFLAHWQHFYQRVSQVIHEPLALIWKGFSPVKP